MKVTVVGAGNVGATCAQVIAQKNIVQEVVLLDIKEGIAEGKSLDLWQTAPINYYDSRVIGTTNDFSKTAGSEVVVITSGVPRKPGMSRDDLISINAGIVKSVTENAVKFSPDAKIVIVSNPLDVMTYTAFVSSHLPREKVMGMAGILDTARYRAFLAEALDVSPRDIQALLLGGHGDTMVPLPRYSSVAGIPLSDLMDAAALEGIVKRTRDGGAEIVRYLKSGSAYYAPSAAVAEMVEAILLDKKRVLPCSAFLEGEYGIRNLYVGVPVVLGERGIERIFEVRLVEGELAALHKSAAAVKELVDLMLPKLGQVTRATA